VDKYCSKFLIRAAGGLKVYHLVARKSYTLQESSLYRSTILSSVPWITSTYAYIIISIIITIIITVGPQLFEP